MSNLGAGQPVWSPQGTGTNDYIVSFETSKNIASEFRSRSVWGKLSKPMEVMTVGAGQEQRDIDIGASAVVWSKEITSGDECRFTLEQNMIGAPTFGDAEVRTGSYLAYLHQTIFLNKLDTPATPMPEEMSRIRVRDTIANYDSSIRKQQVGYLAEQHVIDNYSAYLRGASDNLTAPTNQGGKAVDLGLGAGVQVSPENFVVAGTGVVSGTSGTAAYETNLATAFDTLNSATSGHRISRSFVHELRAQISQFKIAGVDGNGSEKWYCAIDPILMNRLTSPDGVLYAAWIASKNEAYNKNAFTHGSVELEDIIFFPDQWLQKFRPDKTQATAGVVQWGPSVTYDRRSATSTSSIMLACVFGNGAILEGHNGSVDITYKEGNHGKGKEIASHVKQAMMRSRYIPKDGRTGIVLNQSSMCVAFADPGLNFGA